MEWGKKYSENWRKTHDMRIIYFYTREKYYYLDFFLTILTRNHSLLHNFLSLWGNRLDYSIHLRNNIDEVTDNLKIEVIKILPDFSDKDDLLNRIDSCLKTIQTNIFEYNNYLKLLKTKDILVPIYDKK